MEGVESAVSTVNNGRDGRRNDAAVATDAALYFTYIQQPELYRTLQRSTQRNMQCSSSLDSKINCKQRICGIFSITCYYCLHRTASNSCSRLVHRRYSCAPVSVGVREWVHKGTGGESGMHRDSEVAQELRASNASLHAKSTLADGRVRRLTSSIYY